MLDTNTLWLYFVVIFGVVALPGMDMAYVMGSSFKGGLRTGLVAVAGIVVGGVLHLTIGATGVAAVLKFVPWAFNLMLFAGATYIAWLGVGLLRTPAIASSSVIQASRPSTHTDGALHKSFLGAFGTCMLNPKAYIFTLAIFPQFVTPKGGPLWLQTAALSSITAFTQIAVYGSLAFLAARAHDSLVQNPRRNYLLSKAIGIALILTAAFTVYGGLNQH